MIERLQRSYTGVEALLGGHNDIGLLVLRWTLAGHMLWAARPHVVSWNRMVGFSEFLGGFGFPFPLFFASLAIASLVVCGVAFVLGAHTRLAAAVMVIYFVVATGVDATRPYPAAYAALVSLAVSWCLTFTGAGRWSLDRYLRNAP